MVLGLEDWTLLSRQRCGEWTFRHWWENTEKEEEEYWLVLSGKISERDSWSTGHQPVSKRHCDDSLAQGFTPLGPWASTGLHCRRWGMRKGAKLHLLLLITPHRSHYTWIIPSPPLYLGPPPRPRKNCLPRNWSLLPKRLGTAAPVHPTILQASEENKLRSMQEGEGVAKTRVPFILSLSP